ncbi:MAG: hypothetical protein MK108_13505 [Mariniblastus sp.]|nr:hypothetical protein [Mariniblastus sp.]
MKFIDSLPVFLILCLLATTSWGQSPEKGQRGMPDSVRKKVEEMQKAGATRQQVREFLEQSRKNMRSGRPGNRPGRGGPRGNRTPRQFKVPHRLDPDLIKQGYNLVVDQNGNEVRPQGRPFQEGYQLKKTEQPVEGHNQRAYARVFCIMAPLRDTLMFHLETTSEEKWTKMTAILQKNRIKTEQWLGGPTPRDNYYSNQGIFTHLKQNGPDHHPMMKYLEEAELELKSRVFSKDFDFTNPQGINPYPNPGQGLID